MHELISLGFSEPEIHPAVLDSDCRAYSPVRWYEEDGYFAIATSTRLDLALNQAALRSGRVPLVRESDGFSVHSIEDVVILGQQRPAGHVTAFPGPQDGNVFGRIGALFFHNRTLALDPAGPYAAVSADWLPPTGAANLHVLDHFGPSGLPLTRAIRLERTGGTEFTTLLSSESAESYVCTQFRRVASSKKVPEQKRVTISLPDRLKVSVELGESRDAPEYVVDLGVDEISLVLGTNFLRRFLSIFDFRQGRTYLQAYAPRR